MTPFEKMLDRQMWENVDPQFKVAYKVAISVFEPVNALNVAQMVENLGIEHDLKLIGLPGDYLIVCYVLNDEDWRLTNKLIYGENDQLSGLFKARARIKRPVGRS